MRMHIESSFCKEAQDPTPTGLVDLRKLVEDLLLDSPGSFQRVKHVYGHLTQQ